MSFYKYYARRKQHPLGAWIHRRQAQKLARLVASYLSPPARILEIGPGDGYFLEECQNLGFEYTALEGSKELAEKLQDKAADVRNAFVPPIPLKDQSVDGCCLFHILEHMNSAATAKELINETMRVLTPNGFLFLACPNYYNWGMDFYNIDYTHNYITTPRRLQQLLTDIDYKVLNVILYSGPVFGPARYGLLFVNRLLYRPFLNRLIKSDLYYKSFVTFLESFAIIAQK